MDSNALKNYHIHDCDSRQMLEHYFSCNQDMVFEEDLLKFPIQNFRKTFELGHIKGDILVDLSVGSIIHHLYSALEFFKHIIVLKIKDRCMLELKRWVDTRTGAFDWCHAAQLHADIEGKSYEVQDKEGKVRSALQHVVKFDPEKENITEPIDLPPADCIISAWLLEAISKDKEDYVKYFRKFSKLLKPGGHFIFVGTLEGTYFKIHKEKFHVLTYDEEFVRGVLVGEGFTIDYCDVFRRTVISDLVDFKYVIFIAAHKEK
ncbi:nicotinamide N-methyltransferase-like [Engystomops pustulosus]|uniref:nicotinamide N-methyltransferase-like n=1 Tax=Engystomops pustulosus TaxID=76066 RepID=UPI003AFB12DA